MAESRPLDSGPRPITPQGPPVPQPSAPAKPSSRVPESVRKAIEARKAMEAPPAAGQRTLVGFHSVKLGPVTKKALTVEEEDKMLEAGREPEDRVFADDEEEPEVKEEEPEVEQERAPVQIRAPRGFGGMASFLVQHPPPLTQHKFQQGPPPAKPALAAQIEHKALEALPQAAPPVAARPPGPAEKLEEKVNQFGNRLEELRRLKPEQLKTGAVRSQLMELKYEMESASSQMGKDRERFDRLNSSLQPLLRGAAPTLNQGQLRYLETLGKTSVREDVGILVDERERDAAGILSSAKFLVLSGTLDAATQATLVRQIEDAESRLKMLGDHPSVRMITAQQGRLGEVYASQIDHIKQQELIQKTRQMIDERVTGVNRYDRDKLFDTLSKLQSLPSEIQNRFAGDMNRLRILATIPPHIQKAMQQIVQLIADNKIPEAKLKFEEFRKNIEQFLKTKIPPDVRKNVGQEWGEFVTRNRKTLGV